MRETLIEFVAIFPQLTHVLLVLKEKDGSRFCVLGIGFSEGQSIAIAVYGVDLPRPNTHDLFVRALNMMNITIEKVVIVALVEATYLGTIFMKHPKGSIIEMDSRPSDAMAIALRTKSPIFVNDSLLEENEQLKEYLATIKTTEEWNMNPGMSQDNMSEEEIRRLLNDLNEKDVTKH